MLKPDADGSPRCKWSPDPHLMTQRLGFAVAACEARSEFFMVFANEHDPYFVKSSVNLEKYNIWPRAQPMPVGAQRRKAGCRGRRGAYPSDTGGPIVLTRRRGDTPTQAAGDRGRRTVAGPRRVVGRRELVEQLSDPVGPQDAVRLLAAAAGQDRCALHSVGRVVSW